MRLYLLLALTGIVAVSCSTEPETPLVAPTREDKSNAKEAAPGDNAPAAPAAAPPEPKQASIKPIEPLDLALTPDELLEYWTWKDDPNWNTDDQNRSSMFNQSELFQKDEDEDRLSIMVIPRINIEEDVTDLELDGGEVRFQLKTE